MDNLLVLVITEWVSLKFRNNTEFLAFKIGDLYLHSGSGPVEWNLHEPL